MSNLYIQGILLERCTVGQINKYEQSCGNIQQKNHVVIKVTKFESQMWLKRVDQDWVSHFAFKFELVSHDLKYQYLISFAIIFICKQNFFNNTFITFS